MIVILVAGIVCCFFFMCLLCPEFFLCVFIQEQKEKINLVQTLVKMTQQIIKTIRGFFKASHEQRLSLILRVLALKNLIHRARSTMPTTFRVKSVSFHQTML